MTGRRSPPLRPRIHTSEEGAGVTHRCSPRLHPQIHSSEEGAVMALRRSPRLRPQFHASEQAAGITHRRSPRLHPQTQANGDRAGVTRRIRRRRCISPVNAALPDDADMLWEILLRLPPQPSSLPRASAVCRRWLGLVTDPKFHRQFYAHHRKPPLLGVFVWSSQSQSIKFNPILDPPDRIPPRRLSLGLRSNYDDLLNCRHGLVLVKDRVSGEIIVCDPITGKQRRVAVPPEFKRSYFTGAVLCTAGNQGHVNGGCDSSPFKVVLVSMFREDNQPLACVYSLETGEWGNLITEAPFHIDTFGTLATLVGNVLYWLFNSDRILEFDLDRQNLAVTVGPPVTYDFLHHHRQIIQAEDGAVGFAILAHPRFQMWQRNANCQGGFTWVPWKTIEMHNILGLSLQIGERMEWKGYDEDNDVIFVYVSRNVYSVQLKSMESKKLYETDWTSRIHPFTSFYTSGTSIDGGSKRAERLHGTSDACLV